MMRRNDGSPRPSRPHASPDPIALEVLRSRLEAVGAEVDAAILRSAVSPVITESKDYSCAILDGDGGLISGAGTVAYHFGAAGHAVRSTLARHGDSIAPGDVFLANDPHQGGGLHPQDVVVMRPIFVGRQCIAWAATSAHMMDMGGMVPGSFAPHATECYQEAIRFPPVRLFRAGAEQTDVWQIFKNNIRLPELIEMDLRSLVAGTHVAEAQLCEVVESMGVEAFRAGIGAIRDLTEQELRRRIRQLEEGVYRATSWTEHESELFTVPCRLTIAGDRLCFDFTGASPQTSHFFNSKPHIIASELVTQLAWLLGQDLPFTQGLFAPVELVCPEGTVVNARPPAPIAAAHMHVALNAAEVAMQCVRLALAVSPGAPATELLTGWGTGSGLGLSTWSCVGFDGTQDAFIVLEGNCVGGPPAAASDGVDIGGGVGPPGGLDLTDVEMHESMYPILVTRKGPRPGVNGAGRTRAGAGMRMAIRPHGTDRLVGTMLGMRRWLPLEGFAGGMPGARTEFVVRRGDGRIEELGTSTTGVVVGIEDEFEFRCASSGGFGDPLERDATAVAEDARAGRITGADAAEVYGVILDGRGMVDAGATSRRRSELRRDRLARAFPARRPLRGEDVAGELADAGGSGSTAGGRSLPLFPGVVQRGRVALTEEGGCPLAIAPAHWTDGCPTLERKLADGGPGVVLRSYLDPETGRALYVEAVPAGEPRSFESAPRRWTESAEG